MRATHRQLAQAVTELLSEGGESKKSVEKNFFQYLMKKRLMGKSEKILAAIERYSNEKENILPVKITTAHPLEAAEEKKVEREVKKMFPEKHLTFSFSVRPDFLGGIRIDTENDLYDATLRRSLQKLSQIF